MKRYQINPVLPYLIAILFGISQMACNVAEDNKMSRATVAFDQTKSVDAPSNKKEKNTSVTIADFKKMSTAQQWEVISAGRRDDLRRRYKAGEELPKELKKIIANDLAFENGAEPPTLREPTAAELEAWEAKYQKAVQDKAMSLEEMWKLFSHEKKEYIRQNVDKYPQFKPFF